MDGWVDLRLLGVEGPVCFAYTIVYPLSREREEGWARRPTWHAWWIGMCFYPSDNCFEMETGWAGLDESQGWEMAAEQSRARQRHWILLYLASGISSRVDQREKIHLNPNSGRGS